METRHARMGKYESIAAGLWRRGRSGEVEGNRGALCKASACAVLTMCWGYIIDLKQLQYPVDAYAKMLSAAA